MDFEEVRLSSLSRSIGITSFDFRELTPNPAGVRSGQMWRARWDDVVATVFIDSLVGGTRNEVRVAPITIGADSADERAIVLPENSSTLAVELSVWPQLVTNIAEVVLERWVANVERFPSLAEIEQAAASGDLSYGFPILNNSSQRAADRRLLELVMESLASAADLISGNGSLPDLIVAAGITVTALAKRLNVANAIALGLAKGTVPLDLQQARLLSDLLERDPTELMRANPSVSEDLVTAVTSQGRHGAVRQIAVVDRDTDSEALATIVQGALALAARGDGRWVARVDLYLQVRLGGRA